MTSEERTCPGCGLKFWTKPLKHNSKKFHSPECYHKYRVGKPRSEETKKRSRLSNIKTYEDPKIREKISRSLTGKKRTPEICQKFKESKRAYFADLEKSKIARERMSEAQSNRALRGDFHSTPRGKVGKYTSSKTGREEFYQSSFELMRMKQLDSLPDVIDWTKKHGIKILYGSPVKRHVPDFLVQKVGGINAIEEVKGWVPASDMGDFEQKTIAALTFCEEKGWGYKILFWPELQKEESGIKTKVFFSEGSA